MVWWCALHHSIKSERKTSKMRLPTEAETLQASAIVVAAPRYMGTFATAVGIDLLAYWPGFAKLEIGSGAAMAILEGWAIAFMFRKWRTMQPGTTHWWVLLVLQILLMVALPATAAPYLASSQLDQPVADLLHPIVWWAWIFTVAAIAPLVLAAVGYADVELPKEKKQPEAKQPKQSKKVEQKEQIAPLQELALTYEKTTAPLAVACSGCGATFAKVQGLNAHKRHCSGVMVVTNGKH